MKTKSSAPSRAHIQNEESDEEDFNIRECEINQFVDTQGNAARTLKPYLTKATKTKDDLLPLRLKMMRDYAKSKATNDDQVYYKIKSREQQLANSKFNRNSYRHPLEESRQSSINSFKKSGCKQKSITLSRNKKKVGDESEIQINKPSLEGIVIQNNEYFHRMNESVMNRLLGIIQNTQSRHCSGEEQKNEKEGKGGSTHHHSLAESRHIVINNILPKKSQHQTNSLINSKIKFSEEKVQKLYSQRKTFSYATPKGIKEHLENHNHTEMVQRENSMSKNNFKSLKEEPKFEFTEYKDANDGQKPKDGNRNNENSLMASEVIEGNFQQKRQREFRKERRPVKENEKKVSNQSSMQNKTNLSEMKNENDLADFSQPTYRTEQNILSEQHSLTNRTQMNLKKNQHPKGIMARFQRQNQVESQSQIIYQSQGQKTEQKEPYNIEKEEKKAPVFLEIPIAEETQTITLAEAFKRKIGKLPSQSLPKKEKRPNQALSVSPIQRKKFQPKKSMGRQKVMQKQNFSESNFHLGDLNCSIVKSIQGGNSAFVTPKSSEPSEDLINRLIGGSKAKISKKQMYALTKKNYENLPQVKEKKKLEKKKQLEKQRMERIKQYQRSIRASKTTISSGQ